ncbi:hypothetical protein BDY17DRAFT_290355 [Neohortaea acidophila]|uniref:Uncharacterized protein n=1 Tax=Neohortaea acidophila TaxID=245834 RepID=A0A6A6Q7A1_9PEZI|nr:uncharacterized protein BDY17DRAFT_290355 [Neohortaea acidophila]KAF2488172.1 hypothetical protein BDY17DRAFT_290355 [Neohortaea acidophila]
MAYLYGSDFIDQTNGAFDSPAANHQPSPDNQPPRSQHADPVPSMLSPNSIPSSSSSVLLPQRRVTPAVSQRQHHGASQIPNSQHLHRSTSNSAMPTPMQTPALGFRHLPSTPSAQTLDEFQYQNNLAFDNISNGTAFSSPYFIQRDDGVQSVAGAQQYGTMTSSYPVSVASNTFHQPAAPSRLTTPACLGNNQAFQGGSQYQDNLKQPPSAAYSSHQPFTGANATDSQEAEAKSPLQITDSELEHASVEHARVYIAHAGDYQPLEIIDDDWQAVRRVHFKYLCAQLFNSLCQPAETDLTGFKDEERAYAERVDALKPVLREMDTPEKISMAKAHVMLAVDEAIRLHEIGVPPRIPGQKGPKDRKNVPLDKKAKCSDRILRMIECVRQNKHVAMDVLRGMATALAMYPEKHTNTKVKYLRTNATKSVRMQGTGKRAAQGEGEAEDFGRTPTPSVNGRGKSESRQASVSCSSRPRKTFCLFITDCAG